MPAKWYESNKRLFVEERDSLADNYPFLKMEIVPTGTRINRIFTLKTEAAIVSGIHRLSILDSQRYLDYRIAIVLPDNYPRIVPIMFCNDKKLPIGNIDRHIMSDGSACLGVTAEISQKWRPNPRIVPFLNDIISPFLVWQAYYDSHGQAPPWGQRSHYGEGVLEFYSEILQLPNEPYIVKFIQLLARKNNPQGHEGCPCGSGGKLRNCHHRNVSKARESIAWQDAKIDLLSMNNKSKKRPLYLP
ncbi:MAG: hypothetical protein JRD69_00995 [Deltaproteobacteria bacterium]|nr:hypothetical protein [Deltaproteobacteria bacterium]